MVTPYSPAPANAGGRIRLSKQIEYFGSKYKVTLVSFVSNEDQERVLIKDLSEYCERIIPVQSSNNNLDYDDPDLPVSIQQYKSDEMINVLISLHTHQFDVAILDHIYLAQYRDFIQTFTVLIEHNVESVIFQQVAEMADTLRDTLYFHDKITWLKASADKEARLLSNYETENWRKFPIRMVVSPVDKKRVEERCSVGKTFLIENGVEIKRMIRPNAISKNGILFTASMLYLPNLDALFYFYNEIWPKVINSNSEFHLYIAGSNVPIEVRKLAEHDNIEVIPNPKHIEGIASKCSVAIAPIRLGAGTRGKILHTMAMGLPTITTSLGCEGLAVEEGIHLLIRDNPTHFAEAILELKSDARLWATLRRNGRRLVQQRYSWTHIFSQMEDILKAEIGAP